MNKILEFLRSSSGESSSKRLAFIISLVVACYGTVKTSQSLIDAGKAAEAVDLWNAFFVFSAFLGGFVTVEVLVKIMEIYKGKQTPAAEETDKPMDN